MFFGTTSSVDDCGRHHFVLMSTSIRTVIGNALQLRNLCVTLGFRFLSTVKYQLILRPLIMKTTLCGRELVFMQQ